MKVPREPIILLNPFKGRKKANRSFKCWKSIQTKTAGTEDFTATSRPVHVGPPVPLAGNEAGGVWDSCLL